MGSPGSAARAHVLGIEIRYAHPMASADQVLSAVLECVRALLRERQMTYRDLAEIVGVSEVTIKRWMTADDLSLIRLGRVAEALGTTTFALLRRAEIGRERTFEVSEATEAALADDPEAHVAWDALRLERSPESVRRHYGHCEASWFRLLGRLEQLALIERHPGGRVRLLHRGVHSWRSGGPLQRRYRGGLVQQVIDAWDGDGVVQLATRVVGAGFLDEAELELLTLARTWRDRAWRDQLTLPPADQRRARWMLVLQQAPGWPALPLDERRNADT